MPKPTLNKIQLELAPFVRAFAARQRILTADPSTTGTGIAIHDTDGPAPRLVYVGRLAPSKRLTAYERVDQIVAQTAGLIDTYGCHAAVIETTSGKTSSRHQGRGAGLAVYGVAVGAVRQMLRQRLGEHQVAGVLENLWTARTSKAERWLWCRAKYPSFAQVWAQDEGHYDASDATYLFDWCLNVSKWAAGEQISRGS